MMVGREDGGADAMSIEQIVGSHMKKINPLEIVQDQYQQLKEKLKSAPDIREKNLLFRRLVNLVGVMQFLISINKNS